ncbi:uncharacterized protein LOC131172956 [Hevea brasiliensis]|uniref:uncharacterized protein LOC131172956 n=1 Tax=Hevea brasiliensis TaxID=3981 RepID=UPI0025E9388A|nr:uncharacterized protein LOC131172956 [Hevea brasiliensis]
MGSDRRWMYARLKDGLLTSEFIEGIEQFITFAKQHPEWMDGDKLKCPCNHRKCQNRNYADENTIRLHLMKHGFVPYYYKWILHGEPRTSNIDSQNINVMIAESVQEVDNSTSNTYEQMRLQRLYASNATAKEMRWHAEHDHEDGVMCHCSDATTWKHFNKTHPSFAAEVRNEEYMFLTVLVPGPRNPKDKLDVYLQPLIAELKQLWEVGVETYDASKKNNFNMRVALLWTISDFPAYSMLSGWSTAGKTACPYCRDDSDAFTLTKGGKQSWFDNHHENNSCKAKNTGWKRRSIFWDLPYWSTNMLRHNLDVMHIEKNVFENIFNTVMNVEGKTKDNAKSREDLKEFCHRPELERDMATGKYPKACYTLDKQSKAVLCEWLKNLRFPDGYVSNMGRCIDMRKLKLFGMKSHDCHVFMQRLLPIAFRELLPKNVWQALTELSNFFRELTSTTLREEAMLQLNEEIPIILCKLERIFPPSFFDSMEHLPVHLAYEAWIAGPVQYRWMYPFERYLRKLKNNVKNKAKVEGSICNAYLVEEASSFCAHYFEPHVNTRHRKVPRNDDTVEHMDEHLANKSIFTHSSIFVNELHMANPNINDKQVDEKLEREFDKWFNKYVHNPSNNISSQFLKDLSKGPLRSVMSYNSYVVNGYKFHTKSHGSHRATMNSGVCIKGTNYSIDESDYYGQLIEVLRLEYTGLPIKRIVLFKCDWFDPTMNVGTNIHPKYKLVDINKKRSFNRYKPFVLAIQAAQVNYSIYPSLTHDKDEWWAMFKIKAISVIDLPNQVNVTTPPTREEPFQEDEMEDVEDEEELELDSESDEECDDVYDSDTN